MHAAADALTERNCFCYLFLSYTSQGNMIVIKRNPLTHSLTHLLACQRLVTATASQASSSSCHDRDSLRRLDSRRSSPALPLLLTR